MRELSDEELLRLTPKRPAAFDVFHVRHERLMGRVLPPPNDVGRTRGPAGDGAKVGVNVAGTSSAGCVPSRCAQRPSRPRRSSPRMPGMSADELITELRRLGDATPIILASGYDAHELSQRFVGRGLAAFLQRPYHLEELHATALEIVASASRDRL